MIPANQWSDNWQKKDFHLSLEQQFEAAQLDAFKAGAEWAANIIPKFYCESHDRRYAARETRDRIVDEISNLKELPK